MTDEKPAAEYFTFELNGKEHTLPRRIPFGALRKARGFDFLDQIGVILEEVADKRTLAELDKLDPVDVATKLKGWFQGATPGESSASEK